MEAVKNAVAICEAQQRFAIADWNLFRAITDGNQHSCALTVSINPNPAVWEIVFNSVANQVLQDLNK
jgi:hypothetical protein